ncbi:MAG: ATP synthase subunit I [Acholeplasmataceae bacterium]|nr:ATP synthase subunit I [Candidatus Izemoplasmatales bacterium]
MEKKMNVIEKTFLFAWPYTIIVGLLIYLIWGNTDYLLSFVLGSASSLLMNSLNYRIMKAAFKFNPASIKSKTILMYVVKFVFFGIILYISNTNPDWNIYFTFIGLLTFRIILLPLSIFYAKKKEGDTLD